MSWQLKRYSRSTGWHNNAGFHSYHRKSFWDRFKRRRYRFEHVLESNPNNEAKICLVEKALTLRGYNIWEWLEPRATGNIYWTADCQDHVVSQINALSGRKSVAVTKMTIEFSDKGLAMLWKMTWCI